MHQFWLSETKCKIYIQWWQNAIHPINISCRKGILFSATIRQHFSVRGQVPAQRVFYSINWWRLEGKGNECSENILKALGWSQTVIDIPCPSPIQSCVHATYFEQIVSPQKDVYNPCWKTCQAQDGASWTEGMEMTMYSASICMSTSNVCPLSSMRLTAQVSAYRIAILIFLIGVK